MGVVSDEQRMAGEALQGEITDAMLNEAIKRARERAVEEKADFAHAPSVAPSKIVSIEEARKRRGKPLSPATEEENVYCERCQGVIGHLVVGNHERCSCARLFKIQSRIIADFATGNMGEAPRWSEAATDLPHESLIPVYGALRKIASGERERGLILFGEPGRGKTFAAVTLVHECCNAGRLAGYFNVAEVVSRIQSTYSYADAEESRHSIIQNLLLHDPVVLDDLGKERVSEDVAMILYEIIDGLSRKGRTVVICSNLKGEPFASRYDGAVQSRIMGLCEKMVVKGEDLRAKVWEW